MPSIPGFDFPPTSVVQSTAFVAGSGVDMSKAQVQTSGTYGSGRLSSYGGFNVVSKVFSFTGTELASPVSAFQGAGGYGHIIVAKLEGSESQSVPVVYGNVVQNPSFEAGFSRWGVDTASVSGTHTAAVVSQFPIDRGFDSGNPSALDVPHGQRMLHIIKAGETGYMSVFQVIDETSDSDSFELT